MNNSQSEQLFSAKTDPRLAQHTYTYASLADAIFSSKIIRSAPMDYSGKDA